MTKFLIATILVFPAIVFGQDIKCPKGYQPYANRCVTQRMADYISCIEASGGNRQQISEEVSEIGGQKASTGIKASGSGVVVKGAGSLLVNRASEIILAKRWETRWFANSMSECTKALDKKTIQDIRKETTKTRILQEKVLANQNEIKAQNQAMLKQQDNNTRALIERMDKLEKGQNSMLIEKYPYGYCLFAIDHRNIIIPNNSVLLTDYAINWNSAKILNITKTTVSFMLPTFTEIKHNYHFQDNISIIPRIIGMVNNPLGINDTIVSTELLEDTDKGIVGLIGFRPRPKEHTVRP